VTTPATGTDVVSLHVWRAPAVRAVWRVARDRSRLRRTPGVQFVKLVGTGRGREFGPTRADLTRWAAIIGWTDRDAAARFDETRVAQAWRAIASAYCRIDLRPIATTGSWAGRQPFRTASTGGADIAARDPTGGVTGGRIGGGTEAQTSETEGQTGLTEGRTGGPVLALTRARLRPRRALVFWRAIAPVGRAAAGAEGLRAAFGIGEAPIGWQGTISLWRSTRDLVEFAYRHARHTDVVERTPTERWYAEELFARFSVLAIEGDRDVIGWTADEADESERTGTP
jgi:hypothetical protein